MTVSRCPAIEVIGGFKGRPHRAGRLERVLEGCECTTSLAFSFKRSGDKRPKKFSMVGLPFGPSILIKLFSGVFVRTESFRSEEHTSELQSLTRISYAVF